MEEVLHGLIMGIFKMTYLSILKNCFKVGNASIGIPKAKGGLMLRYRVEKKSFLGNTWVLSLWTSRDVQLG